MVADAPLDVLANPLDIGMAATNFSAWFWNYFYAWLLLGLAWKYRGDETMRCMFTGLGLHSFGYAMNRQFWWFLNIAEVNGWDRLSAMLLSSKWVAGTATVLTVLSLPIAVSPYLRSRFGDWWWSLAYVSLITGWVLSLFWAADISHGIVLLFGFAP
jgi:hypothetical protein